jgi:hypothetical protein
MTASWAPDWPPRRQRRAVDRRLRELWRREVCSVCGKPFTHNGRVASGFDARGNILLVAECCSHLVVDNFGLGLVLDREYDFLPSPSDRVTVAPTNAQIADRIATHQKLIDDADKLLADAEQRGGVEPVRNVSLRNHPWKDDDRKWFERNPSRAHRMRLPFAGETDDEAEAPVGHTRVMLVRQVEPGARRRTSFYLRSDLLQLPDIEGVAHALFELAMGREPMPRSRRALCDLIDKYMMPEGSSQ